MNNSCTFAPNAHVPHVTQLQQWPSASAITLNTQTDLPDLAWWRTFNCPELNQLIKAGLERNNQLGIAITNIDFARSQLEQIQLGWLPGMSVLMGLSQFPIFANPGGFIFAAPLYTLNAFQLLQQQKSAKAMLEASVYAKDAARLTIIAQVSRAYFTLIAEQEAYTLYRQLRHDTRAYQQHVQTTYHAGLTTADTIETLQSKLNLIDSRLSLIQHNLTLSRNALHYLLNEDPGKLNLKQSFRRLRHPSTVAINLPLTVLHNRPDVRQAEQALHAASADIGATVATLLPNITVGAYLGQGTLSGGPFYLNEDYLTLPPINPPVLGQIHASQARYRTRAIQYRDTVRQALREVDNDLSAYRSYTQQLRDHQAAFSHQQRHCHWAESRFRHGISTQIEVLQCHITLDQLAVLINQHQLDQINVLVTLYQDLAGGYRHGV